MSDTLDLITQYLQNLTALRRTMCPGPSRGFYGPEDFVLQRGVVWRNGGRYSTPVPRACFERSTKAALRKGSKYVYCEGWAVGPKMISLAVHHAWLMRPDRPGLAYETAWPEPEGAVYLGVAFTAYYLRKCALRTEVYGSLLYELLNHDDDWDAALWTP